ncbi:MAG: hypothetical protein ACLTBF_07370 [Christensenellales bacterium]
MKKRSLGLLIALALLLPAALAQATTTTVMMYMCGTDLQSYCVQDMYEMASVDLPEDVTIAVQAGGAYEWDDSDLTGEAITASPSVTTRSTMWKPTRGRIWATSRRFTISSTGRSIVTRPTATSSCCGITAAHPAACVTTRRRITTV